MAWLAARLVVARGYAAVTMADVGEAAQVSIPWLYKAFGPKPALVKRCYDVLLAEDPDAVPMAQRPAMRALAAEPDPRRVIQRYAAFSGDLLSRVGPLAAALLAAGHSGNPELARLADTIGAERLAGATAVLDHLAKLAALSPQLSRSEARDLVWMLISPEVYRMLVLERGWAGERYERWLADSLAVALL